MVQKQIEVSIACAVWADLAMVLVAPVGILWLSEQASHFAIFHKLTGS